MHELLNHRQQLVVDMNGVHSMHAETSSGYSSRESMQDLTRAQNIQASTASESNCSCGKSNSSKSSQRYNSVIHLDNIDNSKAKGSPRYSYDSPRGCPQQIEALHHANEQLLSQRNLLEEQNNSLLEELQVSRRFYQGVLSDLTSKLSVAENRIKYLKEIVSTQEEALLSQQNNQHSISKDTQPSPRVTPPKYSPTLQQSQQPVLGTRKVRKSSINKVSPPSSSLSRCDTGRSSASTASSVISESSNSSRRRSPLHGKNYAKMKMQLLERNQQIKTDIQILKELPRSSSVPVLSSSVIKEHEGNVKESTTVSFKENQGVLSTGNNQDHSPPVIHVEKVKKKTGVK